MSTDIYNIIDEMLSKINLVIETREQVMGVNRKLDVFGQYDFMVLHQHIGAKDALIELKTKLLIEGKND